jgi:hypothetical protein
VSGNGSYTSDPYSPLVNNTFYSWLVSYSGDLNNGPVSTLCDDGTDSVVVPQYCPPPPCPPPTGACGVNETSTTSTSSLSCVGSAPHLTITTVTMVGPANVCTGTNKSISCAVVPGGEDINTNVETVSVYVAEVPTMSIWGLVALVAGLGALALRRLRWRSDA